MIIKDLEVKGFRGLRKAMLKGFTGINMFVGRNGCGKSSILEALYIVLTLGNGLRYIAKRRGWFGFASVEALFYGRGREAEIGISLEKGFQENIIMKIAIPRVDILNILKERGLDVANIVAIDIEARGKVARKASFYIDASGREEVIMDYGDTGEIIGETLFIDWNSVYSYGTPEDIYSEMIKAGGDEAKKAVVKALKKEYEELQDITVIRVSGIWVLHLVFKERSVPYYVMGDGIKHALIYLMRGVTPRGAVLLMEEPELHTHPALMKVMVSSILNTYRERGNQVFLSTHSLELIDMILEEARKLSLRNDELKIYRLRLIEGELKSEEYSLDEAFEAVKMLEWDLRR